MLSRFERVIFSLFCFATAVPLGPASSFALALTREPGPSTFLSMPSLPHRSPYFRQYRPSTLELPFATSPRSWSCTFLASLANAMDWRSSWKNGQRSTAFLFARRGTLRLYSSKATAAAVVPLEQ